ncbi:hypothetical protein FOA52_013461 [Chlamydomonas sp. UWO 241]|nr:hypothetical protein FOA52_013461 [Chlamydomonas sp. UWO 241]
MEKPGVDAIFYWVEPDTGKEVELGRLKPQTGPLSQWVSVGDNFIARKAEGGDLLGRHTALFQGLFVVKEPGQCNYMTDTDCKMINFPEPTDAAVLTRRIREDNSRIKQVKDQPPKYKKYTEFGFSKTKAPRGLWQALRGYFDANKDNAKIERWEDWQIFSSQFDAPSLHAPIMEGSVIKPRLNDMIMPMLSAWAGGVKLEPTALYGVRIYTRGSWLKLHVDRADTHIISAIVNIDQDVDEPWPLQIRDHAGNQHNVTIEPGEMVMYEGAVCEHGRQVPFNGRWFANTFIHFKVI